MKNINLLSALIFIMLASPIAAQTVAKVIRQEPYRPQYHYSPIDGWIGDPCGLIYYQDQYHLYTFGRGKAVSKDLVHYQQTADNVLTGDDGTISYFTGSVAIDKINSTGFGKNAWIAVYTIFTKISENQSQGISYSTDGNSFQYYKDNPVIDLQSKEFRDPTIFWYKPTSKWIMVVAKAKEKKVKFYESTNLKEWVWLSDFGPAGAQDKVWECPDLFQLNIDGNPNNTKWVMVVSIDWAREQYFIGDFDGKSFKVDDEKYPLYVDKGLDYYASRVFRDYDNTLKKTPSLGWIATWDYALSVPSSWGKGFWSIPRDLELKTYPEGLRMIQKPEENLKDLRVSPVIFSQKLQKGTHKLPQFMPKENVYELDVVFSTKKPNVFGFNLCVGEGRKVSISYNTQNDLLEIDRTNCSNVFIEKFARKTSAKVSSENGKLRMHIFVDKSSVELFINQGKDVFTLLTYPSETQTGIEVFSKENGTRMNFSAWTLKSVWR
ncbi:fructan beta-fructosidase [Flavobacterium sp. 1]|uniref:glycoside hydrolase family 32 protein n=1 Tax=Flavobacterium sp. 1 TaxID=2035200 RepID=UPI000C23AA4D|nr:glycoside hydrolase family 32 protein [Flavobacterium sp. 1]PJJ07845.1 fructan beta-fructosidase [Flavobacterium sp. 1]